MATDAEVRAKYEKAVKNLERLKAQRETPKGISDEGYTYALKVVTAIGKDSGADGLTADTLKLMNQAMDVATDIAMNRYHFKY